MATVTHVTLVDSIDGKSTEDVETVTFFHPMTGQKMEIELNAANRKAMGTHLERMNKYFDAAVVVEEVKPTKAKSATSEETAKIREWARANGFEIGDRGRIKAEILEAYKAAHEVVNTTEASVALDGETQVLDEPDNDEVAEMSDEKILELMAEIDAEGSEVTAEAIAAKLDETDSK